MPIRSIGLKRLSRVVSIVSFGYFFIECEPPKWADVPLALVLSALGSYAVCLALRAIGWIIEGFISDFGSQ